MRFLAEPNKEGHIAFTRGLASTENPYHLGTGEQLGWLTGWEVARMMEATQHPDDQFKLQVVNEKKSQELAGEVLRTLFEEGALTVTEEKNGLTEYWKWLDSIDPRVKEVLIALDDDMTSGRIGARAEYLGQLEVMLLLKAKDGADFIDMYALACHKDKNDFEFRTEASKYWNMVQAYATQKVLNTLNKPLKDV